MFKATRLVFVTLLGALAIFCSGSGRATEAPVLDQLGTVASLEQPLTATTSIKRCQLTGYEDRGSNALSGRRTGMILGGGSSFGVSATDIGWAFEDHARGQLKFLFGDTHQFPVDRCEPWTCGTVSEPIEPPFGEGNLERWQSEAEWDDFRAHNGDGQENMAAAPISGFDPDNCIPLTVRTDERGEAFDHRVDIASYSVEGGRRLPAPKIATGAEDRWVVTMGASILVITSSGSVFRHNMAYGTYINQIDVAAGLGSIPVYANDKAALVLGNHILMVRGTGYVDAYPVLAGGVGFGWRLGPMPGQAQPLVATTADARQIFANPLTNQILVNNAAGQVFFHSVDLVNYRIETPYQLSGQPGVLGGRLGIVADAGGVRLANVLSNGTVNLHTLTSTSIGPGYTGSGAPVAARPTDRWVVAFGNHLIVLTDEQIFHPTRLNGHPVGRREGVFSGFADGATNYVFFTRRHWQRGCPPDRIEGCMHDDPGGPSKTVLARSSDGSNDYDEIASVSTSKFLFVAPEVISAPPASWNLPAGFGGSTVVMFGSGRVGFPLPNWGNSYPYLAVAPLGSIWQRTGQVHVHPVSSSSIGGPSQLSIPSYGVATNPQDRWVIGRKDQILVIDSNGAVHAHPVGASSVGVHTTLPASSPVATSPMDRWVLAKGNDHLVIVRYDGLLYMQPVGTTVGNGYQLGAASGDFLPLVGHLPEHKWVTVLRNSILVLTRDGRLLRYTINASNTGIFPETQLGNQLFKPMVDSIERFLAVGTSLYAITTKGTVYSAPATVDSQGSVVAVGTPTSINGAGPFVAGNAADRWVLSIGDPNLSTGRVAVIPYFPKSGVWMYYAGRNAQGLPIWSNSEAVALPLPPFGAEGDPLFHRRLGYFSARYMPAVGKWLMLYHVGDDPLGQPHGNVRGVYLRTAATPMGPWSAPTQVWRPDQLGYCFFMFNRCYSDCIPGTPNPYEGAQRDHDPADDLPCLLYPPSAARAMRAWGGEYAPLLLPSAYYKSLGGGAYRLYYSLSTWNPYQSVLMSTDVSGF
jgi:hypothetical protein